MRYLSVFVLTLFLSTDSEGGSLTPGGGMRTNGTVTALDALGSPFSGFANSGEVHVSTGTLFGLSTPTPVDLTSLEIQVTAEGVDILWSASGDAGVAFFRLERGALGDGEPEPAFQALGPDFHGEGPHRHRDDTALAGWRYAYRLLARLRTGELEILGPWTVEVPDRALPPATRVLPARPNPFREAFTLAAELLEPAPVTWTLIDARGALIAGGDLGEKPAGAFAASVRVPEDLPRGIYFLRVEAGGARDVQKLVRLP